MSFSVVMPLSTVFHSINSHDNSPFSHSALLVLSLPFWSFHLRISVKVPCSPDVIPSGWMGSKHQLTNWLTILTLTITGDPWYEASRGMSKAYRHRHSTWWLWPLASTRNANIFQPTRGMPAIWPRLLCWLPEGVSVKQPLRKIYLKSVFYRPKTLSGRNRH